MKVHYYINYGGFRYSDLLILKQYGFKIQKVEEFKAVYVATSGVSLGSSPLGVLKNIIQLVDDEENRGRIEKALGSPESCLIAIACDKPVDEMPLKPSKSDSWSCFADRRNMTKQPRRLFDEQIARQTREYIEKNVSKRDLPNTTLAQLVEAFQYGFGNHCVEETDEIEEKIIYGGNAS